MQVEGYKAKTRRYGHNYVKGTTKSLINMFSSEKDEIYSPQIYQKEHKRIVLNTIKKSEASSEKNS